MHALFTLSLALVASAKTIPVDVGPSGALSFSPSTITGAAAGDVLEFHFHPINHSVVMSDFDTPCVPAKSGGFYSGFMPVSSGEGPSVFQVTINSTTNPIFFYCAQNVGSHCVSGMAGVVNPSGAQTLAAYQQNAAKTVSSAVAPAGGIFGGALVTSPSSSTTADAAACTPTTSSGGGGYKRATTNNPCGNAAAGVRAPLAAALAGLVVAVGAVYCSY